MERTPSAARSRSSLGEASRSSGEEPGGGCTPGALARATPPERLRALLACAVLAPSRNNTQPWTFEIEGPELRVYGDWERALRVADPYGRELVMACGAAVQNVEIGAARAGFASSVEVLAGSRKDGLLARFRLEEERAPTASDEELFAAIPVRRTNRHAYAQREVPPGLVSELVRDAASLGASLRPVEAHARVALAELVARAMRDQWANPRFRAELASWSRPNALGETDGMPGYAHGLSDSATVLRRLLLRLGSRALSDEQRGRVYALHGRALLVLATADDAPADWLLAGRAMQRVLLRATARGLSASYFSPVVEHAPIRARLRRLLGERRHPQLVLRLGFGSPVRATPRRPVQEVLRSYATALPRQAIVLVATRT